MRKVSGTSALTYKGFICNFDVVGLLTPYTNTLNVYSFISSDGTAELKSCEIPAVTTTPPTTCGHWEAYTKDITGLVTTNKGFDLTKIIIKKNSAANSYDIKIGEGDFV